MRLVYPILSFCSIIVLFSACQEENLSKIHYQNKLVTSGKFLQPDNSTFDFLESGQINDHLSFILPRIPRPLPCPVLAGCQLPRPEFMISVVEGGKIGKILVQLYTESGDLYASSSKEYDGQVTYLGSDALASLTVINEKVSSEQLFLSIQVTYEFEGKAFSEEYFNEDVPVSLVQYSEAGNIMFRYPRIPRPLPCPVLSGCQIPDPELHVIVPGGAVLEMNAQLYTDQGELYACSGQECEGEMIFKEQEALATLNVVNPEIETKSLNLVLQITYEVDGEIISEEIYDEKVPIDMD